MPERLTNLRPAQARLVSAIAEHGQLQLAAQACNMSPPAASRMLSDIERDLYAPLFERTPKGMVATFIGEVVARRAARVVAELRDMERDLMDFRSGRGGRVRVGAVTGPALGSVAPAVLALKSEAPRADIAVEVAPSAALVGALARGELDFAFARLPEDLDPADFDIQPALHENVVLLVRAGHPLAARSSLELSQLANLPWILQQRGAPIRQAVETAYAAIGRPPPGDVVTTSSLLFIMALLVESDAVAAMTREVADLMVGESIAARFRILALTNPINVVPYQLLRARDRLLSPIAQRLYQHCRERAVASSA
ncbi:LysR family transcriptional regulator [Solirhodobacter olei]|uniref:LysR family transcriptional regulator n=1 Tax=Solirhodobacter olei TaxID=2493082 RepID=UPI000FDC66AC|nr:LysR family transcriptional regulator [Solirhodobacter olei]